LHHHEHIQLISFPTRRSSDLFERAKDQLDLYANLSHKVHIDYVDVDKKPQLAREAGIKNYGTTVVQIGAKREEAKSTSEEDITGDRKSTRLNSSHEWISYAVF